MLFICLWLVVGAPVPAASQGARAVTLISVQGATTVRRSGSATFVSAARRMELGAGDVLRTGPDGRASLLFADGSQVKVNANTLLLIPELAADRGLPPRLGLSTGELWARVTPGRRVRVETPSALAWVRGTELDLTVAADGTATLAVAEGEVRFENDRGSVVVRAAQQSTARPGQAPSPPVAANLPILLEWTNDLLPIRLVLETRFVSNDPGELERAEAEAAWLRPLAARRLREGDVLHDRGRLVEALAAYDRALALAPEGDARWTARTTARRGHTLLELGRPADAERELQRALAEAEAAEDPETASLARAGRTMSLLAQDRLDAARGVATASETGPSAAPVHLARALVEIRRGDTAAAAVALDAAMAADPRNGQARAWHSYVLRARNDLAGAEAAARQAVALEPYSAVGRQMLADVHLLQGRAQEARREARQAVALNPLSAPAHVSLANAELFRGRVDTALRLAYRAEALDPHSDRAQYTLGAALAAARSYRASERHLRRAVELNPDLLDARGLLGRVLAQQGERTEAVAVAQGTLDRTPQLPSARAALGQVYRLQGRLRDAAREYEAALALSPRSGLYHVEAARVYLDLNDLPSALSHALDGVFLLPGSGEAHAVLGLVYDRQDNREQATRTYSEAISLSPDNSLARLGLVTAFGPRSAALLASGRLGLRERAQALLRDPAVLQQTFEPGVTSELAGGVGSDRHEEQRYLHRGQWLRGRLHDLLIASRFSDDGDRANGSTSRRSLQADVAFQASPRTQLLLQYQTQKHSGGLPGASPEPAAFSLANRLPADPDAYASRRQDDYHLHLRRQVSPNTFLWLSHGRRALHSSRRDPDALAGRADLEPLELTVALGLFKFNQRQDERITELRLDHRTGRHHLTYGLAYLRDNLQLFDLKLALPGENGRVGLSPETAVGIRSPVFARDFLQYLQDGYRIGNRGSLIVGAHLLRAREHSLQELRSPIFLPSGISSVTAQVQTETDRDVLPYAALTYSLGRRDLVRLLGHATRLRVGDPLLAPSEAFIIGEPVSLNHNGRAETYELDYEHRFSRRLFVKLFAQQSHISSFLIQPTLDQRLVPVGILVSSVQARVAGVRVEGQINRHLSGFTRWSYWRVLDSFDQQVPFYPRCRGLTGLTYVDRRGVKMSLTASFFGPHYVDVENYGDEPVWYRTIYQPPFFLIFGRARAPSYVVYDLHLGRESSVGLEYALTIRNLFDKQYDDWVGGFPASGRTWLLTLARRY